MQFEIFRDWNLTVEIQDLMPEDLILDLPITTY